jgi:penicillin-binding protein 2
LDSFLSTYQDTATAAAILRVTPRLLSALQTGTQATVSFAATLHTAQVGTLEVHNEMALTFQDGRWGVRWSPALIFPQLSDDSFVQLTTQAPPRGNIYDRNGSGLAVQGQQVEVEVGIVPGHIEDETAILQQLSVLLGETPAELKAHYADMPQDWYVPLGRISAEAGQAHLDLLESTPGVHLKPIFSRAYIPSASIGVDPPPLAPHLVGIVGPIPQEEVDLWRAQGYNGDEMVGRLGLERWGEPYLAGEFSARLEILTTAGQSVAVLADRPARENRNLYTTFDREFQTAVQAILGEQLGAIAVLEVNTARVLALATWPLFDPQPFATGISQQQWLRLQSDPRRPMVNRATQGTYPAGSVFKIVTIIAGMEAGGLTESSSFVCKGVWTGLGSQWPKKCWATRGHGTIALNKALTVSCDITFYQVGLMLNGLSTTVLPDYAQRCGFGALTGIEVEESAGLLPGPDWKIQATGEGWAPGDAVNLAIGQGELQVTPLQVAVLLAAVGNGGTLYRPQLVQMIAVDPATPDWTFSPAVAGRLPVSPENLAVIQDSLAKVTSETYGTAYLPFQGLSIAVAGKTGTAESGSELPHSWFAGYAPAQDPEIAIAVIVENSGEGAKFAAPLVRRVVETYFHIEPTPTPAP